MKELFTHHMAALEIISAAFPNHQTLFVGGCVRDALLGIEPADIDIATNIPMEDFKRAFMVTDITKNVDNPNPVVIMHVGSHAYEVAAFRADSAGVGRANNVPTLVSDFSKDSARRDITINALGMDVNGKVYDYVEGQSDLNRNLIRCVGNGNDRFAEDATRILRVLRFAAKFDFAIESDTSAAIFAQKHRLLNRNEISPESIAKEIYKAAASAVCLRRFMQLLYDYDIVGMILPEFQALYGLTHNPIHHPEGGSTVVGHIFECLNAVSESEDLWDALMRQGNYVATNNTINLGILLHDIGKGVTAAIGEDGHMTYHGHEGDGVPVAQAIFDRLKFNDLSAEDKEAIMFATEKHMLIHNLDKLSLKKMMSLVHSPYWKFLVIVSLADEASRGIPLFDPYNFYDKIVAAEERVKNIAPSSMELRRRMKEYIDGHKLLGWIPELQSNRKLMAPIIERVCDELAELLDRGCVVRDDYAQESAQALFNQLK